MPAFLQSFIEAEQERSRRIEQLRKEIREFAKEEAGSSITEQILLFLADEMVEHLSENSNYTKNGRILGFLLECL